MSNKKSKTLVECKTLGIPLVEEVARQVDELMKTLPKEYRHLHHKSEVPDTTLVDGERADISLVSTETVDREGDVVLAKGMQLEWFQRNPVVTFAHKYDELPVGKAQWIRRVDGGIRAKTIYSEATETARACWEMTKEGILKGKSIGFLPTTIRSATAEEISRNPSWKNANAVIDSAVLLEYAVAPIPVNQDSLVEFVSKSHTDAKVLKRLGLDVPAPKKLTRKEVAAIIAREFEKNAVMLRPDKILERVMSRYRV